MLIMAAGTWIAPSYPSTHSFGGAHPRGLSILGFLLPEPFLRENCSAGHCLLPPQPLMGRIW